MKDNYTHITFLLDASGSMGSIKSDTIGGFNSFLDDQKKESGECTVSLIQFNTSNSYNLINDFSKISDVVYLTDTNYMTKSGTPLFDSLGKAINDIGSKLSKMDESYRPSKVIFVILTDGEENSSTIYNNNNIKDMITKQESVYNWKFVYLGANQDAFGVSNSLGISKDNTLSWYSNKECTINAFQSISKGMSTYRSSVAFIDGPQSLAYFDDNDRMKQKVL